MLTCSAGAGWVRNQTANASVCSVIFQTTKYKLYERRSTQFRLSNSKVKIAIRARFRCSDGLIHAAAKLQVLPTSFEQGQKTIGTTATVNIRTKY